MATREIKKRENSLLGKRSEEISIWNLECEKETRLAIFFRDKNFTTKPEEVLMRLSSKWLIFCNFSLQQRIKSKEPKSGCLTSLQPYQHYSINDLLYISIQWSHKFFFSAYHIFELVLETIGILYNIYRGYHWKTMFSNYWVPWKAPTRQHLYTYASLNSE